MPIFYTDIASFNSLSVTGSTVMSASSNAIALQLIGSGSTILSVSGSAGNMLSVTDAISPNSNLFSVSSGSTNIFVVDSSETVVISGSLLVSGSIIGTASFSTTSSFALNAGGGSGFPFNGTAVITGSIVLTSGSGFPSLLAAETLAAGDFVNISNGGVRKASSTDIAKQAHGFVTASYSATDPVVVFYSGLLTGVVGLSPGTRYFLSASGVGSPLAPTLTGQLSQEIGVAISSRALLFQPGPAIIT
jgi:hypothetical protein